MLRRLMPTSLRGQILLAVLLALAVAQGIGAGIAVLSRQQAVRAAQLGDAFDRAAAVVYVLERTPPGLHANLLRAAETPLTRLTLAQRPALPPGAKASPRLMRRLVAALDDATARDIRMAITVTDPDAARPKKPREHDDDDNKHRKRPPPAMLDAEALTFSIPVDGAGWLNAEVRFPRRDRGLPVKALLSFVLAAAAIGVALWLTLARILGPLRGLAGAAERLGRGEAAPDLAVSGPAEMQALTRAFNVMQGRLHRMVSDRTQMLAALGHDLRSPLTALRVQAEMVDDDETREQMLVSLAEMQEMVEQTLTYARGVWTAEAVETVDARDLLAQLAEETGADFTPPRAPVPLRLRPATIRRALRNLLDNARRYGDGAVELSLTPAAEAVEIAIADRGPGIPEAELAHVFDPFVRLEASRSRETGGTGLGLSIARSIVQAHGGEVVLENRVGGGLLARVTLPRPAGG